MSGPDDILLGPSSADQAAHPCASGLSFLASVRLGALETRIISVGRDRSPHRRRCPAELHEGAPSCVRPSRRARPLLVHTGQHHDFEMSRRLLRGPRAAGAGLSIWAAGSGSHTQQTARHHARIRAGARAHGAGRSSSSSATSTHARMRARRGEERRCRGARGGRPPLLRPLDARGDQPHRDVTTSPTFLYTTSRDGDDNLCARASRPSASSVGNPMIDTLLRLGARPRTPDAGKARARAPAICVADAASAGERRRAGVPPPPARGAGGGRP